MHEISGFTRRQVLGSGTTLAGAAALRGMVTPATAQASQARRIDSADFDPAAVEAIVREHAADLHMRSVIYRVVKDGIPLVTNAIGDSMTGVPATTDMHFRNGAVAIGYLSTLLLVLVDQDVMGLDEPIATWLPDFQDADLVTPRMLINMTAGYPDYVPDPGFAVEFYADPFRSYTADQLIERTLAQPRTFAPGENWDYSHGNIVILGKVIEAATETPIAELMRTHVLDPLGLTNTVSTQTAEIPDPVLHAFSSERKAALGIPDDGSFYEESTFWNPSWTLAPGAVMTTNIADMTTTAIDWAEGSLLTPESHTAQITPLPYGFGSLLEGCRTCHPLDEVYSYALGLVKSGDWLLQNPFFGGYVAAAAVLPAERLAIAVATTLTPEAFLPNGDYNPAVNGITIVKAIAATMTDNLPLM